MQSARFDAVRARVLAKAKPFAPPLATIEGSSSAPPAEKTSTQPSPVRARTSSGRIKMVASRKRKAPSSSSSTDKGETFVPEVPARKIKAVTWPELLPESPPADREFTFDNIDSLWYRNLDYGSYLRSRLLTGNDQSRNEDFIRDYGSLRLVKSSVTQIIRSAASILSTVPTLAQIIREHDELNPEMMDKLKQELGEKEKELAERDEALKSSLKVAADLEAKLKTSNELLLQRDEELKAAQKALADHKAESEALEQKLRQEVIDAEDLSYVMYQDGFDQAIVQVKHFNIANSVDLSRIDRDRKLEEILGEGCSGGNPEGEDEETPMSGDEGGPSAGGD